MTTVSVEAAKARLLELIEEVERGGEVVITRDDRPIARLVLVEQPARPRRFGSMKGKIHVGPEFFEPLPEEELKAWE